MLFYFKLIYVISNYIFMLFKVILIYVIKIILS